jgi:hypothetical protein
MDEPNDIITKYAQWTSAPESERRQLEESLRHQYWTSSHALIQWIAWAKKWAQSEVFNIAWLNQFLKKRSRTKRGFIRIPIILVIYPVIYICMLLLAVVLLPFYSVLAVVRLAPTYIRFRLITSKELRNFDRRIQDQKIAIVRAKIQEQVEQQLRTDDINRKAEERFAKTLIVYWRREFQKASSEKLLEVWAVLQQFPTEHPIYFMLENSPGPILRSIVDQEVANRSISIEARQLALLRLEMKTADSSQHRLIEQVAYKSRQDAEERHSDVMGGLMSIAMLHLFK